MSLIDASGLEKSFAARHVLAGVDLALGDNERVGLVGRNGCGKSTLGRILAGRESPDAGTIARRRGATVEYLPQEPELPGDQTISQIVLASLRDWSAARRRYDDLTHALSRADASESARLAAEQAQVGEELERLGGWERHHEAEAIIGDLGLRDPSRRAGALSGGERRLVALARVLVVEPSLAILDEPTNHLDVATIEWLEDYLCNRFRGALLLITHDRTILDRVTTRTLELEGGRLASYDGGYAAYLGARAERAVLVERGERNRQNFLRRELEWLNRQPKARGTKQKARVARAEQARAIRAPRAEKTADLRLEAKRQGKTVLEISDLKLERGGETLVDSLELRLAPGQRIGVVGRNGTGKTSLLLAILGELEPTRGSLRRGANTRIGILDQERSGLDPEQTVFESLGDRSEVTSGGRRMEVAAYLERFLFDRRSQRIKVGQLSGGERARVCLAKLMADPVNLVLLDEPTNDLDVSTLGALEAMLLDFSGSAIIVSHDRWLLDRVATSILAFEGNGRVELHAGNYSDYRERGEARRQATPRRAAKRAALPPAASANVSQPEPNSARKLSYNERRELEGLPDAIDEAEAEATRLESTLADPETYKRKGQRVADLIQALAAARARADSLTERWAELEARHEAGR